VELEMKLGSNGWFSAPVIAGLALMTVAATTPVARADVTFDTPTGATDSNSEPVDATATFSISAGSITITVRNLEANPTSDGQTVNGVAFVLSTGQTVGTFSSQESIQRRITSNTGFNDHGTTSSSSVNGTSYSSDKFSPWIVNSGVTVNGSSTGIEATSIGGGGGGGTPTLIGDPNGFGNYSAANPSITNGAHHRFLAGTMTIVVNVTGLLATASVSQMQFEFGTSANPPDNVPGNLVPVPEPSTLAIAGLGALGFVGYGLRRRLKK